MDLMRYQPTFGGSALAAPAEAGRGSWKRVDGCDDIKQGFFDSSKKPEISEQETKQVLIDSSPKPESSDEEIKQYLREREIAEQKIKQLLYESCRKSEISERELQEINAQLHKGADPNKELSESQSQSIRFLLDICKMQGELLLLSSEEREETLFDSDEEYEKKLEQFMEAKAAKELKLKEAKALRKLKIAEKKQSGMPDDEDSDLESDEELQLCEVCMKVVDHMSFQCPYLHDIPNPENATVGKGYEILCHHCLESDHGHRDGSWAGFAARTRDEEDSDPESDEEDSDSESDEDSDSKSDEEDFGSKSDDEP
ncbi:hypothetical protein ACLB2K_067888 [Fragaria x ananassa]